jgi:hypothetical protein
MIKKKNVVSEVLPWLAITACIGIFTFSLTPDLAEYLRYFGIFLSGLVPVLGYHYALSQKRSPQKGGGHLSDAEIDSVYYFISVIFLL